MPRWLARAGARPIHVFFWTGQANSYVRQWVQLQSCFPWSVSCSWNCKSLKQPRGCDCWLLDRWRPGAGEGARACEKRRPVTASRDSVPVVRFSPGRHRCFFSLSATAEMHEWSIPPSHLTPSCTVPTTEQFTYWWYRYSQVLIHNNTGGIAKY